MFGFSPIDDLIDRVRTLTGQEITHLAGATRQSIGFGVSGYLGLRSRSSPAHVDASTVLKSAGREAEWQSKGVVLAEAVLTAAMAAAGRAGRNPAGALEAWRDFQRAVESGDPNERRRAFRACQRTFRRGLGRRLTRDWPMASVGAGWALMALLTWDLATQQGPYTVGDRELLTRPWSAVAELPTP